MPSNPSNAPVRMTLSNLSVDPIDTRTAWANPTAFTAETVVRWTKHQIPGLSYEPKHYSGTSNTTIPLELWHGTLESGDKTSLQEYVRWYESLAYPLASGSLPIVLFRWPRLAAIPCTINSVRADYSQFARDGAPTRVTVQLELEAYTNGDAPTHESIRDFGLVRSGSAGVRSSFLNGVPR